MICHRTAMDTALHRMGLVGGVLCALALAAPAGAQSQRVRLTGLSDVAFGTLGVGGDAVASQSVCAFSSTNTGGYTVTALSAGQGGAFELTSAVGALRFDMMWAGSPNQQLGTLLGNGQNSAPFYSLASHHSCNNGPATSASAIVRFRQNDIENAAAGGYSGTVTLILAPV